MWVLASGMYLGETFANSGGIHQGGKYDGVLGVYLNGDLKKMGLWKGLCFYTRRLSNPWKEHHRR